MTGYSLVKEENGHQESIHVETMEAVNFYLQQGYEQVFEGHEGFWTESRLKRHAKDLQWMKDNPDKVITSSLEDFVKELLKIKLTNSKRVVRKNI